MRQSSNNKNYTNNIATQPRKDERMPIDLCERSIPIGYIVSQFNDCEHKSEYTFTNCSAVSSSTLIGSQLQLRGYILRQWRALYRSQFRTQALFENQTELAVSGCWSGCWVLGAGCWVLGAGCWAILAMSSSTASF
ncbi:hypothetical protein C9J01_15485 [Photobacterium rosenbergii]|uniref:Uncharacterized protein n=1 Tax=Photobacterium rosenbergii TaxID=294936 RepID=A0A2T3ND17_9GAMM|nr:hypothetical protein C9J01_15485 [Photobacterium rosenbergii]